MTNAAREEREVLRRLKGIPTRFWAVGIMALCLIALLISVTESLQLTYISDSEGRGKMLITSVNDTQSLMELSGIIAEEGDEVYYTEFSDNVASLNIQRAFEVSLEVDGVKLPVRMVQGTVEDAIKKANIRLNKEDYTEPALHTELSANDSIVVHRVVYSEEILYENIPYETEYEYTSLYYSNKRRTTTIQKGVEGKTAITIRTRLLDGEVDYSEEISRTCAQEPQAKVIRKYAAGAPISPRLGPDGTRNAPTSYSRVISGKATGYSSKGGRGASGLGLGCGTVAVNPNVIPYGSLLYIASPDGKFVYGYALATDTGTALMDGRIVADLYYDTYAESAMTGLVNVNIYVVK